MSEVVVENELEEKGEGLNLEDEERPVFPEKEYFAEFRFITNHGEHEMWTPWLVYPCGYQKKSISFRKPKEKSKKIYVKDLMESDLFRFYDDIDELIDEVEEEYGEDNVCTYVLPGDIEVNVNFDLDEIKRIKKIRAFEKVPTVLLSESIQIRLTKNNLNAPTKNVVDFYNDFVANGAHEELELPERVGEEVGEDDDDDNLDLLE